MVPDFPTLEPSEILNPTVRSQLPQSKHKRVLDTVLHEVDELRNSCLQLFFSDRRHEVPSRPMCKLTIREYEFLYNQELRILKDSVKVHLVEELATRRSSKRGSNFDRNTTGVLEAAYTRAPTLTHSECKMVARASGLTHQQVRTWFQNKRSRDKKQSRIRSMRSTYRRTIDDSDRGLSPPAAGAAHLDQLVHAPPLGRELELASSGCQTLSSPSIKGGPLLKKALFVEPHVNDTTVATTSDQTTSDRIEHWLNAGIFGRDEQPRTRPDMIEFNCVSPIKPDSHDAICFAPFETEVAADLGYWHAEPTVTTELASFHLPVPGGWQRFPGPH